MVGLLAHCTLPCQSQHIVTTRWPSWQPFLVPVALKLLSCALYAFHEDPLDLDWLENWIVDELSQLSMLVVSGWDCDQGGAYRLISFWR